MSFHQGIPLMRSASPPSSDSRHQEHMLSFSDKPETLDFGKYVGLGNYNNDKTSLSPFLHQIPPLSNFRTSGGYSSGGMMMNMNFSGFTLTQWAELEQQALIYKYITANVPVPSSLLISIKKSFHPYGSFGWGSFHLGLAGGNMDPEPGRCRRTDGKKWRCSKDAVPDQKYCERHINRGRHRSRKPVEVRSDQTAIAAAAVSRVVAKAQQAVVTGNSNKSSNHRTSSNCSLAFGGQYTNPDSLTHNRNNNPFEFGRISSESLLNPNTAKTYGASYLDFSNHQEKLSGNHKQTSWPKELKSDWTQLSMSIPITSSSPSSAHNITAQDKITLSPLSMSREFDLSMQTCQDTALELDVKKVNTWIPISWGNNYLGGPLGEVVNSTANSPTLGSSPNNSSVSSSIAESNRNNGDYFHYTT